MCQSLLQNSERVTNTMHCLGNRDVNFREFHFSIREFQISRLVEYLRLNAAFFGDGPAVALTSSPWEINYCRVAATRATPLDLVGPRHTDRPMCRDSFCCPLSGGCDTFTVCCVSRRRFGPDGWPLLMISSLTLWRPLLPYGYSY